MNNDRHFYLYAKLHYKQTDTRDDLISIQKYYCGGDIKNNPALFKASLEKLIKLVGSHVKHKNYFEIFMKDLFNQHNGFLGYDHNDFEISVAEACLSMLMRVKCSVIPFDLGKPDPKVLPLRSLK